MAFYWYVYRHPFYLMLDRLIGLQLHVWLVTDNTSVVLSLLPGLRYLVELFATSRVFKPLYRSG